MSSVVYDLPVGNQLRVYPPSVLPPSNPQLNWTWREIDANDKLVNDWFWNGNYWLTRQQFVGDAYDTGAASSASYGAGLFNPASYNIFYEQGFVEGYIASGPTYNTTNYRTYAIGYLRADYTVTTLYTFSLQNAIMNSSVQDYEPLNLLVTQGSNGLSAGRHNVANVGSPSSNIMRIRWGATFRHART